MGTYYFCSYVKHHFYSKYFNWHLFTYQCSWASWLLKVCLWKIDSQPANIQGFFAGSWFPLLAIRDFPPRILTPFWSLSLQGLPSLLGEPESPLVFARSHGGVCSNCALSTVQQWSYLVRSPFHRLLIAASLLIPTGQAPGPPVVCIPRSQKVLLDLIYKLREIAHWEDGEDWL